VTNTAEDDPAGHYSPEAVHEQAMAITRRQWDRSSATYDSMPGHGRINPQERAAWLHLLRLVIASPTPIAVLDVGTGTGFFALLIASLGHQVTGVDLSPKMLRVARDNSQGAGLDIAFREGDIHDLPPDIGPFDVVISRHVIWTLPDPVRAISGWVEVTRPGGRVVAVDGFWHSASPTTRALAKVKREVRNLRQPSRRELGADSDRVHHPLMGVRDTTPAINAFERAGLTAVRAEALTWIDDVERRALSPWERITYFSQRYLIEGTRPEAKAHG
jgi:SAM-dependent methyltransferase